MIFDYGKLLGKIKEVCDTQEIFAQRMSINLATLNAKLNNRGFFKQKEISLACEILGIHSDEIGAYFFTAKV